MASSDTVTLEYYPWNEDSSIKQVQPWHNVPFVFFFFDFKLSTLQRICKTLIMFIKLNWFSDYIPLVGTQWWFSVRFLDLNDMDLDSCSPSVNFRIELPQIVYVHLGSVHCTTKGYTYLSINSNYRLTVIMSWQFSSYSWLNKRSEF